VLTRKKGRYFAVVYLIGLERQTEMFAYELELNSPFRNLTYEATPLSSHSGISYHMDNLDCLVFDATHFIQDNRLRIIISINCLT